MILNQLSDSQSRIAALRSNPANTDAQRERYDRMAREMRAFGREFPRHLSGAADRDFTASC